jgi:hypothetical protein
MRCVPLAGRIKTLLLLACAALAAVASPAYGDASDAASAKPVGRWQDASLEDYRQHLLALQALTRACAKARSVKSCDPTLVGPDDRVPISASTSAERRIVRYGWLRILFSHAEEPDKAEQARASSRTRLVRKKNRPRRPSRPLPSFSRTPRRAWRATWNRPGEFPRRLRSTTRNAPS